MGLLVCGYGGFSLRNLWVFRCDAMLCYWFVVGLIEEELVEEEGRRRERVSFIMFFFFNIVLMWKFVGASKALVIYIY